MSYCLLVIWGEVRSRPILFMDKIVCTVNFNTPELTSSAIRSVFKHTPDCEVIVIDNSTTMCMEYDDYRVKVIDNTKQQIINFDSMLACYPLKHKCSGNKWGSAKHCYTIQKMWELCPTGFVLIDSDVLVKKDISGLFDDRYAWVGETHQDPNHKCSIIKRLLPFLCYINVPMCKARGIHYFDYTRNFRLGTGVRNNYYDTGASFLEDVVKAGLPYNEIDVDDYIVHLGGGSYRDTDWVGFFK